MNSNDSLMRQIFDTTVQFKEKLQQMEIESVKLELEIDVLREEKSDTLAQIIETERQIHLWERKIELQEQMKKIIKPESGLKEIDELKSYIHRQKLMYKKLQAEQEEVIKKMERCVQRRDFIKVRYPNDEFNTGIAKQKVSKTKEINELQEQVNHIKRKKEEYTNKIRNAKENVDQFNEKYNKYESDGFRNQEQAFQMRNNYFREKITTNNLFCHLKQNQESSKLIEDYKAKKFRPKNRANLLVELDDFKKENEQLMDILKNFKDTHGELKEVIDEVMKI